MGLHNVFYDGKAKSGTTEFSATRGVDAVESFEQAFLMPAINSKPLVLYIDYNLFSLFFGYDLNGLVRIGIFDGVDNEVDQGLFQQRGVDGEFEIFRTGDFNLNILFRGLDLAKIDRRFNNGGNFIVVRKNNGAGFFNLITAIIKMMECTG